MGKEGRKGGNGMSRPDLEAGTEMAHAGARFRLTAFTSSKFLSSFRSAEQLPSFPLYRVEAESGKIGSLC